MLHLYLCKVQRWYVFDGEYSKAEFVQICSSEIVNSEVFAPTHNSGPQS